MKTAQEYRHEYYATRGRSIPPASFLDDILMDLEDREEECRLLTLALAKQDGVDVDFSTHG